MRTGLLVAAIAAGLAIHPFASLAQTDTQFDLGMVPPGHILLPEGDLRANVVLISDGDGWNQTDQAEAEKLASNGAAVIGIDFPKYLTAMTAHAGDCVYTISDIESLAHQVQRAAGAKTLSAPILAGVGEGGALALAMIAQSPAATIGGAIAVDPKAGIPIRKPLCTDAPSALIGDRVVYGLDKAPLPAPMTVLFTDAATKDARDHAADLVKSHPDVDVRQVTGAANDVLSQALSDKMDAMGSTEDPLGLPITVLPAKPSMDTMAIIYSGDGGWRDLDKEVGGVLQQKGVPVIGVDSLRYFWSEQTPGQTAQDLSRIIEAYRSAWGVHHILLIGYSFGADILPAAYNLLSDADKASVAQITLMAVSHEVDYEVSVAGWIGVSSGSAGDPVDDIAKIDPGLIQCIYGTDESDDACPTLKGKGIELIGIEGGHHFDGDYEALADRILSSLQRRLAARL
ncbi:hypothetical protein L0V05_11155 [Tabrizicola sp. J26]|uniref:AcvB/VirJ family lysyl-phosphatidylglycerol hydrolase n=1 Tax=Alitabrizicola rongguiensis TaxID=2909234 RepID=UPI001F261DD0|nr:AcvB/VirJ family lysyl-phosphatidylglycerol hydrolase [Tabrizicola rongguiensis]MCF1709377.1 hypothetical protein [Tabrizicola rongguiensis]